MKNGSRWRLRTLTTNGQKPLSLLRKRLTSRIDAIGADPFAASMWEKAAGIAVEIEEVPSYCANIIKQEAIASGIDAVVSRGTIACAQKSTNVIITGTLRGLKILIKRLKRQPFGLTELADMLSELTHGNEPVLNIKGARLDMTKPHVMGILNVTPDSFSDGGRYITEETIKARVMQIISEGASFIDVGGVSTRPGHTAPTVEEELKRVLPAVKTAVEAAKEHGVYVSVDSWRPQVIKQCIEQGIDLINNQGFEPEKAADVHELAAESGCAYCIMHNSTDNEPDVTVRVINSLKAQALNAEQAGVCKDSIILDPGFGFVKSIEENYSVLHYLEELCNLGYAVLAGLSRKSMIAGVTGKDVNQRNYATVAAETIAVLNGARIIRTHNVAACVDAMKVINTILT